MPNDEQYWISSFFGGFGKSPVPKCFLMLKNNTAFMMLEKHDCDPSLNPDFTKIGRTKYTWLLCLLNHLVMLISIFNQKLGCQWPCARDHQSIILCPSHQAASIQLKLLLEVQKRVAFISMCLLFMWSLDWGKK